MARRNQYNQYAQPYLPPQSGGNIGYQPSYDPNDTARWAELLDKRQQRYDVGRQNLSQFQGQVGGMNTYAPDLLQDRIGEFTGSVQDMVKTQYGNDFGLAANDIADMIAEEKADPFYKMVDYQNKEAELHRKAQMQKLREGERFIDVRDPSQIDLSQFIGESGQIDPRYMQELQAKSIIGDDYDQLATDLVKDIPANASQYYKALGQDDAELFAQAVGEGSIGSFLEKRGYKGNSVKLGKLEDQLTKSLYSKSSEAFDYEAKDAGFKSGEDYARSIIRNKIPQLSYQQTTKNITNIGGGSDEKPIMTDNPLFLRGYTTITKDDYDKRLKNIKNLDLDKEEPTHAEEIKTKSGLSAPGPGVTIGGGINPKRAKWVEANKELDEFESKYGKLNGDTRTNRYKNMLKAQTSHSNTSSSFIKINDTALRGKHQKDFDSKVIGDVYMRDESGNFTQIPREDLDKIHKNKYLGGNSSKVNWDNFNVHGVNPKTGRIVAKGPDDKTIEYYPSQNMEQATAPIRKTNTDLYGGNGVEPKGFSIGAFDQNGLSSVTVDVYDPSSNQVKTVTAYVDPSVVSGISNENDARKVVLDQPQQIEYSSLVNRYIYPLTGLEGTSVSPTGINQ